VNSLIVGGTPGDDYIFRLQQYDVEAICKGRSPQVLQAENANPWNEGANIYLMSKATPVLYANLTRA
jgi:hypothetical protein